MNISRSTGVKDGALVPTYYVNAQVGLLPFLGDVNSTPQAVLASSPEDAPMVNVMLSLDEVVTRGDGTAVTILELLDSIALEAQAAAPVAS